MNINIDFFKKIHNENTLYHYTKASTAIDFILHNNQLRFNLTQDSIDPIESAPPSRFTESSRFDIEYDSRSMSRIRDHISDIEAKFMQICFCKNAKSGDEVYSTSSIEGYEELFGFAKPRMWDQYADKFNGVCLAFSKEKIYNGMKKF